MRTEKKSALHKTKATSASVYQLRIELDGITPLVWREVWIAGASSLIQLHHAIQAAMGWTDAHLHEFRIGDVVYATPHPEDAPERKIKDERRVKLHKTLGAITRFAYLYDFGDSWQHTITVKEIAPLPKYPRGSAFVSAGARACPPEDAGGFYGYQEFLDRYASSRRSSAVREFLQWAGEDFDPDRFDRHAANAALQRMAWNRWGEE